MACHQPPTPGANMWQHYRQVATIHAAVIQGELGPAGDAARRIVDRGAAGLPIGSEGFGAQMRGYALEILETDSVPVAATATAGMARICGECHMNYGAGPAFRWEAGPSEPLRDDVVEMERHRWAAARLWEGLVGPSDSLWNAGVAALLESTILPRQLRERDDIGGELHGLEARVHMLGRLALGERTGLGRAEIYGELLARCAACHTAIRARTGG